MDEHPIPSVESYAPRRAVDKGTLSDQVYRSLRDDILSNRLPPETPLQEVAIANALDVSRGPVREALRRLAADGLVKVIPRRGAVVSSLSRDEFLDAYRIREVLETLAIRLATSRLTQEDLQAMEDLHEQMLQHARAEEVEEFFAANEAFHIFIVERSGNRMLHDIYIPLINQMRRYRLSSLGLRGGLLRSCEEHAAILAAIAQRDGELAARLLSEHIQVPQRILETDSDVTLVPRARLPEE